MKSSVQTRLFLLLVLAFGAVAIAMGADARKPGNHEGFAPEQPIAFSHRLHAGELAIDCQYCHYAASKSRHAGIPPAGLCMNCHAHVTAPAEDVQAERAAAAAEGREPRPVLSPELAKLYDFLALDENLEPRADTEPRPIPWIRVHDLPDYVSFDHRAHVNRGVACASCHGAVQGMERVRQEFDLSMGWCVSCHREQPRDPGAPRIEPGARPDPHVSTDCVVCHD